MAKRKRKQKSEGSKLPHLSFPRIELGIPERAQRTILAIIILTIALVLIFSFFDNAGGAGAILKNFAYGFAGEAAPLLPLILLATGIVLLRMQGENKKPVLLAFLLLLLGFSGIMGVFASHADGATVRESAGWLGFLVSWPLTSAFGFWVAIVVFAAFVLSSFVLFWQLIPHGNREEGEEGEGFRHAAQEKIKKIFEPKFDIQDVDPEPRIHTAIIGSDGESDKKEKGKKQEQKRDSEEQMQPFFDVPEDYKLPPLDLLEGEKGVPNAGDIKMYSAAIKRTLQNFGIDVEMAEVNVGPAVTQYTFKPAEGVKVSRITTLRNDLALALAAHPIRIEAPIPGRALVGIELPNKVRATVRLRSLLESDEFQNSTAPLLIALGKDVSGTPIYADLAKMPHMLVAGATGSGKTIGLNNLILSLVYRNSPETLRFVLVDPKRVEFPVYNDLPHLLTPVIIDNQRVVNALKWLVKEMDRRFTALSNVRVRDLKGYHALRAQHKNKADKDEWEPMPYIVAVLDELADLMAVRGKEIEALIVRLAQMARAVGIHLVLATQRPSVEVITGLIKANITARVAFQVASQIDSRTILDSAGAEQLLGRGDMLFISAEFSKPRRIQGAFISEKEIKDIIGWIREETGDIEREDIAEDELGQSALHGLDSGEFARDEEDDPLYEEAKRIVMETKKASSSLLQRRLKVGYARAARLIDILEERGVVGSADGAKPREVFVRVSDFQDYPSKEITKEQANETFQSNDEEQEEENEEKEDEEESKWKNPEVGT